MAGRRRKPPGGISTICYTPSFPSHWSRSCPHCLPKAGGKGEVVHTCQDGARLNVWSRWALQTDGRGRPTAVLAIDSDITRQKKDQQKLLNSLRKKDVLLKEIHHRVKNNLQIITSLLSWQSEFLQDKQALRDDRGDAQPGAIDRGDSRDALRFGRPLTHRLWRVFEPYRSGPGRSVLAPAEQDQIGDRGRIHISGDSTSGAVRADGQRKS